MQSFFGFASYYRNPNKSFAHITSSLSKLCSKDVIFEITKERRDVYESIKYELTNVPVLILPDFELSSKLYIDAACSQGLSKALKQRETVDGEPREGLICYISRKLKHSEPVFEVYTDFRALMSLLNMETTSRHMFRWQIAIQEYRGNMTIIYKEGKIHTNADGLSRAKDFHGMWKRACDTAAKFRAEAKE
ncbi:hypothetical protein O181_067467 [Austropuccinia psidii MF-1]|uniref:Reverse transcriptase/retrotransposon-derived protein RNase H-like domain-containing protein n=1 Tax=Austropuccinia psidii MF-1 TaxID=1389203 RepID=A0A9Q3EXF0_9BASI|nr:hypothetical protein [Austropuccinia psidii MF-1]